MTDNAEFEIRCNGEWVAGTSGNRDSALAEARHYAYIYATDGPVEIYELTKVKIL